MREPLLASNPRENPHNAVHLIEDSICVRMHGEAGQTPTVDGATR